MPTVRIKKPQLNATWVIIPTTIESSLRIESVLGQTIDVATLTILDEYNNIDITPMSDIEILDANNKKLFSGLITMVEMTADGVHRVIDLSCEDYTLLLNTTVINRNYVANFSYTFNGIKYFGDKARILDCFSNADFGTLTSTTGILPQPEIVLDPTANGFIDPDNVSPLHSYMSAEEYSYMTLTDLMNTFCDYTGFNYYVDYDKRLHYYDKTQSVISENTLKLSDKPDGITSIGYRGITYKLDGSSIRNEYLITGVSLKSGTQIYRVEATGEDKYLLGEEQIGANRIALAPPGHTYVVIKVGDSWDNLSEVNVGLYDPNIGTSVSTCDCLISPTQRFFCFTPGHIPVSGKKIQVEYVYAFQAGQTDTDSSYVTYGRKFMKIFSAGDSNSVVAVNDKMQSFKKQYAYALKTIHLTIDNLDLGNRSLETGNWIKVENSILGINDYYCIYSITTTVLGGNMLQMNLELRNWYTES